MSPLSISEPPAKLQRWQSSAAHRRRFIPTVRQAAISFSVALVLLLINDSFIFESIVVPTASMQPTILPNERIFLDRIPLRPFRRFDVVVIHEPAAHKRILKRIIGLPGERVRLSESWKVFIDDRPLAYGALLSDGTRTEAGNHRIEIASEAKPPETQFGLHDLQLGPDEFFVLGDNRLASIDSRVIGPIRRNDIQGIASMVWYSFDLAQHRLRTERMPSRVN